MDRAGKPSVEQRLHARSHVPELCPDGIPGPNTGHRSAVAPGNAVAARGADHEDVPMVVLVGPLPRVNVLILAVGVVVASLGQVGCEVVLAVERTPSSGHHGAPRAEAGFKN